MSAINTTYYSQLLYPAAEFAIGTLASIPASVVFTVLHENAHAFMINRLSVNANPEITYGRFRLFGLEGSTLSSAVSEPTRLGKWLGPSYSQALVSSAGPLVDIISMLAITILTRFDRHAARLMLATSLGHPFYSLTALITLVGKRAVPHSELVGDDYYKVLVHGGKVAYGLLTLAAYLTAGAVLGNAFGLNQHLLDRPSNSTSDAPCLV